MVGSAVTLRPRHIPVTIALLLTTLLSNIAAGMIIHAPSPAVRNEFGLGAHRLILGHDVISLVTSVVLANGPAELFVALVALLVVGGLTENRIGHSRVLLVYFATAVGGGLLGTAAQAAGLLTRGLWSTPPADLIVFHPFTPIFGTAMAASAFAGPLWRRRIRVLGLAGLIVVLLYSGQAGDVYRLAGALIGLGLGVLLARNRPRLAWPRSSHHETRTLLAVIVALGAIGPLVAVFQRSGYGLLRPLGRLFADPLPRPRQIHQVCLAAHNASCGRSVLLGRLNSPGTIALEVLPLAVLLVAAIGIWNGRRAAAWGAVLVNGVLGVLAGIYYNLLPVLREPTQTAFRSGLTVQTLLAVLLPLAVAAAVSSSFKHFTIRTRRRVTVISVTIVALTAIAGAAAYVMVGLISPDAFVPLVTPGQLIRDVIERYVPVGFLRLRRLDFAPVAPLARLLSDWIGPVTWAALAAAIAVCCVAVVRPRSAADETRVRRILRQGSTGSLSFMTTWKGNQYWFSAEGRHAIAYREHSGVAVTVGEPVGPPEGTIQAAREFIIACDDRAITPAFYAVRREFADAVGAGFTWSSAAIGEDTVLDPSTFVMKGKQWQDVRSSINRADRLGIRAVWTNWNSLSASARTQIESISEEWIAERRLPELGFTLGGLRELRDREVQLMLAIGPEGRIEAVTSWLPSWRDSTLTGLTLDFMRRNASSMNGVMEFLIASVVTHAQQRELDFVSLSVAPLSVGTAGDPDGVAQLLDFIGHILEPAYGFSSLATFKEKFKPDHVPVVLAYPDAVSLPAISLALTRSYLPGLNIADLARLLGALRPEPNRLQRPRPQA